MHRSRSKENGNTTESFEEKNQRSGRPWKIDGKLIDELTIYYGLSIRRNAESVEKMRNDIYATLYHKISTDDNPQHERCPTGLTSWCSWQRAQSSGTIDDYTHNPAMHNDVFNAIKPIYDELSSDDLLSRCLGGFTQNANESFNSVVWSIAPKQISSGKDIIDIATNIAVVTFNDGLRSIMNIMDVLGITVGRQCYEFCLEVDSRRIQHAEHSMSDAAKTSRRAAKSAKKEAELNEIDIEGQLYGAGIAE